MDDAKAIIEAIERLIPGETFGVEGAHLIDLPTGRTVHNLQPHIDALLPAPRRIEAAARASNVKSLIDYLNRFKLADSALFADDEPSAPSLLGIVDFHGATGGDGLGPFDETPGSTAVPRFGRHTVRYDFPVSEQVKAWSAISGQPLAHADMAAFLDERHYDIANPPLDWMQVDRPTVELILHLLNIADDHGEIDDARPDAEPGPEDDDRYIPRSGLYKLRQIRFASAHRLVQMARTVEISASAKTIEGYQPKTGERTVLFQEEHQAADRAGRKIVVPDAFLLRVPVWEGETAQLVPVRLQYRRVAGHIAWVFTLVEWRRVIRFAVKTEAERAAKETDLPLFYGARSSKKPAAGG